MGYRRRMNNRIYLRKACFTPLCRALAEEPGKLCIVLGPRGAGKSTLMGQVLEKWDGPSLRQSADDIPLAPTTAWITAAGEKAKALGKGTLLVLEEVNRVPGWVPVVKGLMGEGLRVMVNASTCWRMMEPLAKHLPGRYRLHYYPSWSFEEISFPLGNQQQMSLDDYLAYGGLPSPKGEKINTAFWRQRITALMEATVARDVLMMAPVMKQDLMRRLLAHLCMNAGTVMSYNQMKDALPGAGNTSTLANYVGLLESAFLVTQVPRWTGEKASKYETIPKFVVRDNGYMSAALFPHEERLEPNDEQRLQLLKNAIGANLLALVEREGGEVFYWRERDLEVEYVLKLKGTLYAVETRPYLPERFNPGTRIFLERHPGAKAVTLFTDRRNQRTQDFFRDPLSMITERATVSDEPGWKRRRREAKERKEVARG